MTRVVNFCIILTQQQKEEKWGEKKEDDQNVYVLDSLPLWSHRAHLWAGFYIRIIYRSLFFFFLLHLFLLFMCVWVK